MQEILLIIVGGLIYLAVFAPPAFMILMLTIAIIPLAIAARIAGPAFTGSLQRLVDELARESVREGSEAVRVDDGADDDRRPSAGA
jgi:hypothetical protein